MSVPCPRPHGWEEPEDGEIIDTDEESEHAVNDDSHSDDSKLEADGKGREKWLSGTWPIKAFDESLPVTQRKSEWVRFRDQYERITSCKAKVSAKTLLTGLKIYAGSYLLSIIEMQENLLNSDKNIYKNTIKELNKYFEQTCDKNQERLKLREMKMKSTESFGDWMLRLEAQAKFCDFEVNQKNEEIMQALLRRSVPEISEKLYEMSGIFEDDLSKVMRHGQHLDHIRNENLAIKANAENPLGGPLTSEKTEETKQVMFVEKNASRYQPYRPKNDGFQRDQPRMTESRNWAPRKPGFQRYQGPVFNKDCTSCGREHASRNCPAFRAKCYKCERSGHFAIMCRSTSNIKPRGDDKKAVKKEAKQLNQVMEQSDSDEY